MLTWLNLGCKVNLSTDRKNYGLCIEEVEILYIMQHKYIGEPV